MILNRISLFHLFVACIGLTSVDGTDRTGPFSVQPYSATRSMGITYSFYGEGIEYDPSRDRVILGSIGEGKIYSIPYFRSENEDERVVYDLEDMMVEFAGGDSRIPAIVGLEMDPFDPDAVWGAVGLYPPTAETSCGVAKFSLKYKNLSAFYDFESVKNPFNDKRCMANDIVFDADGNLYATDFFGYQVIKVALASDSSVSVLVSDPDYLCDTTLGMECPGGTYDYNGPN